MDAVGVYRGNAFFVPITDQVRQFWLGVVGDVPLAGNWWLAPGGGGEAASGGELLWARQAGGAGLTSGSAIAVDAAGDSLVTGIFNGSATFGFGEPNETMLTADGHIHDDLFVAKYAPDGSLLWVKQAGGEGDDDASGIAVDAAGNSLVTGDFAGSATFGVGEPNETMLSTDDYNSAVFVAKYDPGGSLLWAKQSGGTSYGYAQGGAIAVDAEGNILVTGRLSAGSNTFGAGEPNETVLLGGDFFVAKYAPDGSLLWAKQVAGVGWDYGSGIAVDSAGNILVNGRFLVTATFGAGEPNETVLLGGDLFLAKYAPNGSLLWAKQAGSTDYVISAGIALDAAGNILVTGSFGGNATFGEGTPEEATFTGVGIFDIFLAKYAADGSLLWARQAGGADDDCGDYGYGVTVDQAGNSLLTGRFAGSATFGRGEPNETVLLGGHIFVAKYAPDGTLLWAKQEVASSAGSGGHGIALDAAGDILVTGYFTDTAIFGPGEPNETVLAAGTDMFLAKYRNAHLTEDGPSAH